ncbi:hypothetical protein EQM13_07210 [Acidilutibacter cellobiosedens]|uniref:Uncharacterized protein n=1 Tax=Acidilutibacter cellobiosedens TaxID=2507161 RepID=A0A410QBQ2_9FIRM|nr:hypothetical protein [Acidilutibacter cellobiosedens]QAT61380.1 hypothetical protein EQM13_07210 [Acidilutibacter cellobiosedens]
MATANPELCRIYEGLKYDFLFNNDINSIHILLSLYDLEENITNICPKYKCIKEIKKKIRSLLRYRKDRDLVSNNIILLIHEDIDRLELYFYLEGYKYGYYNYKWVNILEKKALESYGMEKLYEMRILYHYRFNFGEIRKVKEGFEAEGRNVNRDGEFKKLVNSFCERVIKSKIVNINKYIDRQLTIDYNHKVLNIKSDSHKFTHEEINKVYGVIIRGIYKNMRRVYTDASWFGLNDKVLRRYS